MYKKGNDVLEQQQLVKSCWMVYARQWLRICDGKNMLFGYFIIPPHPPWWYESVTNNKINSNDKCYRPAKIATPFLKTHHYDNQPFITSEA